MTTTPRWTTTWPRHTHNRTLACPVLAATDSAGDSVTTPTLAERHHTEPAVIGTLASTFPSR
jgi:hypothetical protein